MSNTIKPHTLFLKLGQYFYDPEDGQEIPKVDIQKPSIIRLSKKVSSLSILINNKIKNNQFLIS